MEHNQFDEMARQAVQASESDTTLDSKQADTLWSQIGHKESKTYVGWWRAAAVILFLLSSSLVWYGSGLRHSQQDLEVQLQSTEEARLAALNLLEQKGATKPTPEAIDNQAANTETIVIRDTIIKTIVEEQIVYVDRVVLAPPIFNADSLMAIIQLQQAELDQLASYAQVDQSKEYLSNFNVVFDNPEVDKKPVQASQKQASFKFNLSLLKRN